MTSGTSIEGSRIKRRGVRLFQEAPHLSANLRSCFDVRIVSLYLEPQMDPRLKLEIAHLAAPGIHSAE
jgi:hypothetical protein